MANQRARLIGKSGKKIAQRYFMEFGGLNFTVWSED
jgi:hypothetical protein